MSNRAIAIAAALQAEMPNMMVMTARYTREPNEVSVVDGPVLIVSDGIASGITLSVYGDEGDDISGLAADVHRAANRGAFMLDNAQLLLSFHRMEPMIDESDFRIGERIHCVAIEHSTANLAA